MKVKFFSADQIKKAMDSSEPNIESLILASGLKQGKGFIIAESHGVNGTTNFGGNIFGMYMMLNNIVEKTAKDYDVGFIDVLEGIAAFQDAKVKADKYMEEIQGEKNESK